MRFNGLEVGQKVTTSGYAGTVVRLCEWSHAMVEVRLVSGVVCVDANDVIAANVTRAEVAAQAEAR